jgi:ketosteroid isomerase-like protein
MLFGMEDAVSRYRTASEAGDIDALMETLAPDVEVVSPISGRMVFRGQDDVRALLGAVYGTLNDLRWTETVGDGDHRVVLGETRVGPVRMTDAMVFELAADGRIRRVSPHLRPWLALSLFAAILGPKVARHPGAVRRALSATSAGASESAPSP